MIRSFLKRMAWFTIFFQLNLLAVTVASWAISYVLSLQAHTIKSQQFSFGYYQDSVSTYTMGLFPTAAIVALFLALRVTKSKSYSDKQGVTHASIRENGADIFTQDDASYTPAGNTQN